MLDTCENQSRTSVQQECILAVDTETRGKGKATKDADSDDIIKLNNLSIKEQLHPVHMAQDIVNGTQAYGHSTEYDHVIGSVLCTVCKK